MGSRAIGSINELTGGLKELQGMDLCVHQTNSVTQREFFFFCHVYNYTGLHYAMCIRTLLWDLKEKGATSFGSILLFQVEAAEALVRNAQFCEYARFGYDFFFFPPPSTFRLFLLPSFKLKLSVLGLMMEVRRRHTTRVDTRKNWPGPIYPFSRNRRASEHSIKSLKCRIERKSLFI